MQGTIRSSISLNFVRASQHHMLPEVICYRSLTIISKCCPMQPATLLYTKCYA